MPGAHRAAHSPSFAVSAKMTVPAASLTVRTVAEAGATSSGSAGVSNGWAVRGGTPAPAVVKRRHSTSAGVALERSQRADHKPLSAMPTSTVLSMAASSMVARATG